MASLIQQIQQEALRYGLDPDLVLGLARTESGLNPSAVGDNGDSIGLFQVQPRWWDAWARRHGWDIRTTEGNIKAGVAILASAIRAEDGNVFNGLRRYNGGPSWENKADTAGYARRVLSSVESTYTIPVAGDYTISSPFGERERPDGKGHEHHTGVDLAAAKGTPIANVRAGVVEFAGNKGNFGNHVIIRGNDGLRYFYAHMNNISVSQGEQIGAGMTLGGVGSTGRATGDHLHFEIRKGNKTIDPTFVFTNGVPAEEGQAFAMPTAEVPTVEDAVTRLASSASRVVGLETDVLAGIFSEFARSMIEQVTSANQAAAAEQPEIAIPDTPDDEFGELASSLSALSQSFPLDEEDDL